LALTEREKQILRLKKGNMSDYEIARKLKIDAGNVTRSRKTALRKIERAQADLDFALQVGVTTTNFYSSLLLLNTPNTNTKRQKNINATHRQLKIGLKN
jgi:hypothetical protein